MRLLMGIIFVTLIHLGSFKAIEDTQDSWTKHLRWSVYAQFSFLIHWSVCFSEEKMTIVNLDLSVLSQKQQEEEDQEQERDQDHNQDEY